MITAEKKPSAIEFPKVAGKPNPVDIYVGSRVRLRRTLLGMSQEKLGEALGLTFQQVQKYERGTNRIGASRLYDLSRVLDVPVQFFFDGFGGRNHTSGTPGFGDDGKPFEAKDFSKREILELARAFDRIKDERVRKRLLELAKSLGTTVLAEEVA